MDMLILIVLGMVSVGLLYYVFVRMYLRMKSTEHELHQLENRVYEVENLLALKLDVKVKRFREKKPARVTRAHVSQVRPSWKNNK